MDIAGDTRISHSIYERATGLEYRFVPEGPEVSAAEMARAVAVIADQDFDWLVASGSLPHGLGPEAYGPLVRLAAERGARVALDTSGPALAATLAAAVSYTHLTLPTMSLVCRSRWSPYH